MSTEEKPPAKPGYQTTEFYGAGVAGAAIVESGALQDANPWVRGTAVVAVAVVAIGYAWVRTRAKGGAA